MTTSLRRERTEEEAEFEAWAVTVMPSEQFDALAASRKRPVFKRSTHGA
ncbi:hypothetical protein [Tsukamurella paurometabola]|uniref:Uncharacterized protein n=1 Tax=Tsukamurella paurometabola TaxID=2061 RepID=A0ABS5NEU4_TSUPA|nr:hypothetical protein [Tsukamurella paurometabola]MBS4102782.1 hypothetical protein [Tsukamurella paurometabola]